MWRHHRVGGDQCVVCPPLVQRPATGGGLNVLRSKRFHGIGQPFDDRCRSPIGDYDPPPRSRHLDLLVLEAQLAAEYRASARSDLGEGEGFGTGERVRGAGVRVGVTQDDGGNVGDIGTGDRRDAAVSCRAADHSRLVGEGGQQVCVEIVA